MGANDHAVMYRVCSPFGDPPKVHRVIVARRTSKMVYFHDRTKATEWTKQWPVDYADKELSATTAGAIELWRERARQAARDMQAEADKLRARAEMFISATEIET